MVSKEVEHDDERDLRVDRRPSQRRDDVLTFPKRPRSNSLRHQACVVYTLTEAFLCSAS
jgi:hypothetical protein